MRHQLELAVTGAQLGVWSYNPRTGVPRYSTAPGKSSASRRASFPTPAPSASASIPRTATSGSSTATTASRRPGRQGISDRPARRRDPLGAQPRRRRPRRRWRGRGDPRHPRRHHRAQEVRGRAGDHAQPARARGRRRQARCLVVQPETGSAWFSDRARDLLGLGSNTLADARNSAPVSIPRTGTGSSRPSSSISPKSRGDRISRRPRRRHPLDLLAGRGLARRRWRGRSRQRHRLRHHRPQAGRGRSGKHAAPSRAGRGGAKTGVWSLDPKTGASRFSDRARDLVGLESNVVAQPRDYKKHVHPDDWDELFKPYADGFDKPFGIEYRIVRADGEIRWVYGLGAPAFDDETGEPEAIHGILLDVTDRKMSRRSSS